MPYLGRRAEADSLRSDTNLQSKLVKSFRGKQSVPMRKTTCEIQLWRRLPLMVKTALFDSYMEVKLMVNSKS